MSDKPADSPSGAAAAPAPAPPPPSDAAPSATMPATADGAAEEPAAKDTATEPASSADIALFTQAQKLLKEGQRCSAAGDYAAARQKYEACREVGGRMMHEAQGAAIVDAANAALVKLAGAPLAAAAQRLLREGHALKRQGDLAGARAKYEKCAAEGARLSPDDGRRSAIASAAKAALGALADAPHIATIQTLLGEGKALARSGDVEAARAKFEEVRVSGARITDPRQRREVERAATAAIANAGDMAAVAEAQAALREGQALAANGDTEGALAKFAEVRAAGGRVQHKDQAAAVARAAAAAEKACAPRQAADGAAAAAADDGRGSTTN